MYQSECRELFFHLTPLRLSVARFVPVRPGYPNFAHTPSDNGGAIGIATVAIVWQEARHQYRSTGSDMNKGFGPIKSLGRRVAINKIQWQKKIEPTRRKPTGKAD